MANQQHVYTEPSAQQARLDPTQFLEAGKKRMESMMDTQARFFDVLQDVNREWLERAQSEAGLAAEFWNKLAAVRSVPDAAIAYQDWASRRMQMFAEDGQRLLSDGQKFMEAGARLFANGGAVSGS
jgi:hypothetical protein